jgi:hypothetical protein
MVPLAPLRDILFHLVSYFDLINRGDSFLVLELLLGAALYIELILDVFIHNSLHMSAREYL